MYDFDSSLNNEVFLYQFNIFIELEYQQFKKMISTLNVFRFFYHLFRFISFITIRDVNICFKKQLN